MVSSRQLRRDALGEVLAEMRGANGPVSDDAMEEVRRLCQVPTTRSHASQPELADPRRRWCLQGRCARSQSPGLAGRARELDADVLVSAVTLAEVVRGVARDAGVNRILKAMDVWPADEPLARQAGRLLGKVGCDATVDASMAATARVGRERHGVTHCVVLTSDPHDLHVHLADEPGVRVVAV